MDVAGTSLPRAVDRISVRKWVRAAAPIVAWVIVFALPMAGLASLLLRSQLDPHIENYPLHFVVFGIVGAVAFALGYAAGEAANRRGDARVLLLSLAFMATGGFLFPPIGTPTSSSRWALRLPGCDLSGPVRAQYSRSDRGSWTRVRSWQRRSFAAGCSDGVLAAMAGWFGWSREPPPGRSARLPRRY
jgi:hypothetical protein